MWRSNVLFPVPLPPMMMKTSPFFTLKLRSCMRTKLPYAIVRSSTAMCASSDAEDIEDHGEQAARADDPDDPGDHRGGGRVADGRCAPGGLHPTQTARQRDQ